MAERPKDLIYALDERPPAPQLLALGFQHAAVICPYLVMVALVAGEARLPQEAARNAMGLAMIAVGFLTILQSLRLGWVGSGYLCPPVVSAIYLPSSMAAASFGFPVVCGMVMFAGGCEVLVAGSSTRCESGSWSKSKASSAGSLDISPGCMRTGSSAVRKAKRVKLSSFSGCESY